MGVNEGSIPIGTVCGRASGDDGTCRGQFYHHMKELALGGYIAQKERGRYMLSSKGMLMFATLMCLIHALSKITRQAEERLVEPGDIS